MRLSALQRFILRECYLPAGRQASREKVSINRASFKKFYKTQTLSKDAIDSLTKSLERLIDKGLLIGYGRRTPKKWFIEEVRLTPLGRRTAKATFGQQQRIPFH